MTVYGSRAARRYSAPSHLPGRLDTPRRRQGRWQPWQRRKCGVKGHGGPPARAAVPILCIPSDINNNGRFCAHAADARGPGLENLTETQKDLFLDGLTNDSGVIDFVPAAEKPAVKTRVRMIGDKKM